MQRLLRIFSLLMVLILAVPMLCEASVTHCKGIKLCGKVKVVKHFADLKVQVVKNFPDLKVKKVKHFPNNIGEWQFVTHGEDFTIQYVDNFPDLKIKFVEHFPGQIAYCGIKKLSQTKVFCIHNRWIYKSIGF